MAEIRDALQAVDFAATVERLKAAGMESPRLEARLLHEEALRLAEKDHSDPHGPLESLLARRINHEPMAYILGHKEFWGLDFLVGPGVLVPRPDTETIIDAACRDHPDHDRALEILDLGTGSGCILAALLQEYPKARGTALEASPLAQKYAKANFRRLGLSGRVEMRAENWVAGVHGSFDLVVSNPPYIESDDIAGLDPDVAEFEPASALDGGPDGLSPYRILLPLMNKILNPGGMAYFEFGRGQDAALVRLAAECGLELCRVACDLAGIARVLVVKRP